MEDEVDRLVAGWRRALPELDVSPLEVLSRVTRLARHLDRQRGLVFARHDLETWTFDVLSALRRTDPPHHLSPGQLLAQTLVTSGTMTNRIDHLEARASSAADPTRATPARFAVQLPRRGAACRWRARRPGHPRERHPREPSTRPNAERWPTCFVEWWPLRRMTPSSHRRR